MKLVILRRRPSDPSFLAGLPFILLLCAALAGCASQLPTGPFRLVALDEVGAQAAVAYAVAEEDGFRLRVRPLNKELDWLERRVQGTSPVMMTQLGVSRERDADNASPSLIGFDVTIEATGKLPVHLQSQGIRLWLAPDEPGPAPLDYTRAYELLRPDAEGGDDPQVAQFMKGLLDGSVDVAPGKTHQGLLVFPNPLPVSELLLMDISFIQVGSETHRVQLRFLKLYEDAQ